MGSPLVLGMGMLPLAMLILKGRSFHQQLKSLIMETKKRQSQCKISTSEIWSIQQPNATHKTANTLPASVIHCHLLTEAVSQYSGSYSSQWAGETSDSARYFFVAILFSLKDCKQSLISLNKLGINQQIASFQPRYTQKRFRASSQTDTQGLPRCLLLGAAPPWALSSDTLHFPPTSPQRRAGSPPGQLLGQWLLLFQPSQPKIHLPIFTPN